METFDKWFAIVNPVAGSGKGLSDWPLISKLLRDHHIVPEYAFTERKYHAIELAVEAINNGFRKIMVVGGDGTIHEVVNGLFIQKAVPTTEVLVGVIAVGTGNDWIRMFGIPRKYSEAIRAIVSFSSVSVMFRLLVVKALRLSFSPRARIGHRPARRFSIHYTASHRA